MLNPIVQDLARHVGRIIGTEHPDDVDLAALADVGAGLSAVANVIDGYLNWVDSKGQPSVGTKPLYGRRRTDPLTPHRPDSSGGGGF